jgi:glycosyltransferase involved in cell wall biosynthesis
MRPFIVQSRKNKLLLENLLKDNAPILFEGIHTCYYLEHPEIQKRFTMVRMHNLEHEYYKGLKKNASLAKKIFFKMEAAKLENYQWILSKCSHILTIKEDDADQLRSLNQNVSVLPASIPDLKGEYGSVGRYALFHGNLSVPENIKAVHWIIETLDSVLDQHFELIIAGKNPGKKLRSYCEKKRVKLIANPNAQQLDKLVRGAQIHVLYTPVPSGVKLKLLACLHSPGHILMNSKMLGNKAFLPFCVLADNPKDYKMHFIGLKNKLLTQDEFETRSVFLHEHFNNAKNCELILKLIEHA